jgi:hypothetical protein
MLPRALLSVLLLALTRELPPPRGCYTMTRFFSLIGLLAYCVDCTLIHHGKECEAMPRVEFLSLFDKTISRRSSACLAV